MDAWNAASASSSSSPTVTADRLVVVQALKAFDNHEVDEIFSAPMTEGVAHLIVSHYLRLLGDPVWQQSASTEPRPE